MADHLLDHAGGDVEMGARPDAAVHHRKQHAARTQLRHHLCARDAGAVRLEEHEIGFRLLHLDAVDLR